MGFLDFLKTKPLQVQINEELSRYNLSKAKHYEVDVVGVTFNNDDGSNRKDIICTLKPGDVVLVLPYIFDDEPAMGVYTVNKKQIGKIPGYLYDELAQFNGKKTVGRVSKISGTGAGEYFTLIIDMYII